MRTKPPAQRSLLLPGLVAAVLLLGVGSTAAWAAWTASATVPGVTVKAGSLDLQFADATNAAAGTGTPYSKPLTLSVSNLTPGESAAFTISPKNAGTTRLNYTISASSSVAGMLGVRMYTGVPGTQTTVYPRKNTCSGAALGTELALGTTGLGALDLPRTLGKATSETLCVVVSVQKTAPAPVPGVSPSLILDFTATQAVQK